MNKQTIKTLIIAGAAIILLFIFVGTERINQGNVGIKAKLSGSDKGVQEVTEVSGWCFYNRFSYSIYEMPTFVQHKEYSGENSFIVNSKDGSEFHVSPILNYFVQADKVVSIFKKYRRDLPEIEEGFIKTSVYDAFRIAANSYTADSLISNRESFEVKVKQLLAKEILQEGFTIQQFTSNLTYPETFKKSIEAKNAAVQKAFQIENEVKQTEAQAKISIVQQEAAAKIRIMKANAYATSTVAEAKADAEANRLKQSTITGNLIQWEIATRWDGKLPTYGQVPSLFKNIGQ